MEDRETTYREFENAMNDYLDFDHSIESGDLLTLEEEFTLYDRMFLDEE